MVGSHYQPQFNMAHPYTAPEFKVEAFNCPHCHAFAKQLWFNVTGKPWGAYGRVEIENLCLTQCQHCYKGGIWQISDYNHGTLVYPSMLTAIEPNPDMPDGIKVDFEEARQIANRSPRGAAALLRLVIQKLCIHLGLPGKKIDDDIAELVKQGLPKQIQQALDIVRVVGNESVHPGTLDLNDDPDTTSKLFSLVNLIVSRMITDPKETNKLYLSLPETKRKGIEERDRVKGDQK